MENRAAFLSYCARLTKDCEVILGLDEFGPHLCHFGQIGENNSQRFQCVRCTIRVIF